MMLKTPTIVLLLAVACSTGCSRKTASLNLTKTNRKYALTCIFYREKLDMGDGTFHFLIDRVAIRDDRTGTEIPFIPEEPDALSISSGFYTDVWSPDEEFLILPLGRFQGFRIFKAETMIQRLKNGTFDDFIRIRMQNGVGLWHEFEGWKDRHTFAFTACLSGDPARFSYLPFTGPLNSAGNTTGFIGLNSKGEIPFSRPGHN
jgi:hypothetical protein